MSLSIKVYGEPKYIQIVKAGSFNPAPKVDSAILSIENLSKKFFDEVSEERFFEVIKTGFAHKRKLLLSNLSVLKEKEEIKKAFVKAKINEKARAEVLSLEQWLLIVKII